VFLGIDLGTSSLKALLVDERVLVVGFASAAFTVSRPHPGWSEQDPLDWWAGFLSAVDELKRDHPAELAAVHGIGLSGQMHGAVLLDAADAPLRPAILWNDGRAEEECRLLLERCPDLVERTGNLVMPGFTAPKLLWVARHEPEIIAKLRRVLLPKAWLRLARTGEAIEEMSDASGSLWLDVARRAWWEPALTATGLSEAMMPRLVEGNAPAGQLRGELVARWGMTRRPVVAGGAGDNAASAVGLGAVHPGDAFVSLGTSGVVWVTDNMFRPNPSRAVHTFCHALPGLWHQMAVILSAAASLSWWAGICGCREADLLAELHPAEGPGEVVFRPYLDGERTPHNDPKLRGAFRKLSSATDRPAMTRAVLEGVAFALRDGLDALKEAGSDPAELAVVGGGSRSEAWMSILAGILDKPLYQLSQGEHGAALGAARLARLAVTREAPASVCVPPARSRAFVAEEHVTQAYRLARSRWLG
jgi:xylulokinase